MGFDLAHLHKQNDYGVAIIAYHHYSHVVLGLVALSITSLRLLIQNLAQSRPVQRCLRRLP